MLKILSTQNHTDFETLHGILFFAICFDKYCTSCQSFEVLKIKGTIDETMSIQLKTALLCLDLYVLRNIMPKTYSLLIFSLTLRSGSISKTGMGGLLLQQVMHGSSATMFSKQKICLQRSEQKGYIVKIFSAIVIWQSGKIAP